MSATSRLHVSSRIELNRNRSGSEGIDLGGREPPGTDFVLEENGELVESTVLPNPLVTR
jgi:hypothetical protein